MRLGAVALLLIAGCGRTTGAAPAASASASAASAPAAAMPVRCVVIGGMMATDFWPELAERFEHDTGVHVEVVASGNKAMIEPVMRRGDADLITMHASDAILNLVADGIAMDPQPWARNDHVIVGPKNDPAHVRGTKDAVEALKKIVAAKASFVVSRGHGANEVLGKLLSDGKMQGPGMDVMVEGDARLRRPFLVAIADPRKVPGAHVESAKRLAAYPPFSPVETNAP